MARVKAGLFLEHIMKMLIVWYVKKKLKKSDIDHGLKKAIIDWLEEIL